MKKTITKLSILLFMLMIGVGNVWGENKGLTFVVSSNPGGWPTVNSTTLTNYTYTLDGVSYTFALKNVKCNSGYLMLTQPAALGLPAIDGYKLTKVVAHNSSTCSTSVNVGISSSASSPSYLTGGDAKKWASTGSAYTYNLSGTEANTMYYLYVTSKNGQIVSLDLTYEETGGSTTKTLESIAVSGTPTKTTYNAGDTFDPTGLTVTGTYSDNSQETITEGITWSATPSPLTAGTTSVSVTATVNNVTSDAYVVNDLTVNAAKTLEILVASGTPAEFWKGDEFNTTGMTFTATYSDDTEEEIPASNLTITGYDMATAGSQTVTVSYTYQSITESDTYTINVKTIANTQETAYTVAQAKALIDAGKDLATEVYVAGKISQIDSYNSTYNSITYWISEDGTTTDQFEVYGGLNCEDEDPFSGVDDLTLGYDAVVYGKIKKYNTIYEFDLNSQLVSYTAPAVDTYTVSVAEGINYGTVTTNPSGDVIPGVVVTITATPTNSNYKLVSISVTDSEGDPVALTDDNKFTMPESDVTVYAEFAEKAQFSVTYTSLGQSLGSENVMEGSYCQNVPQNVVAPEGWTFAGWTTETVEETTGVPTLFNVVNEPVTATIALKALFTKIEGGSGNGYNKVTTEPSDWSGEYLLVYEDGNLAWTGVDAGQCHVDVTIADGVIATKPEGAATLTIAPMDGGYSIQVNGGNYMGRSANSNGLDLSPSAQLNTLSVDDDGNTVITAAGGCTMRYNKTSGTSNERFRYYKSGQEPVQLYKYVQSGTIYYTTEGTVPPEKVATPTISPNGGRFLTSQEISIECATVGATITYTTDDWATYQTYTAPFTITETTTVKAKATMDDYDDSNEVSAVFTAIETLSMTELQNTATTETQTVYANITNWIVTGVKGSNVYLTDGNGKGILLYQYEHRFNVGDKLNGMVQCQLQLYHELPEIKGLKNDTEGLNVLPEQTIDPIEMDLEDINETTIYSLQGALVTINNVVYSSEYGFCGTFDDIEDGDNKFVYAGDKFYEINLNDGVEYSSVTGVITSTFQAGEGDDEDYVFFELSPRSADDLVEKVTDKYAITIDQIQHGTVVANVSEAAEGVTVTLTISPDEGYILKDNTLVVLDGDAEDVTLTQGEGNTYTFTMPASDVTVSAEFEENTTSTHYVMYVSLGEEIGNGEDVNDGELCANVPTVTNTPTGWTFAGWTTNDEYQSSTTAPAFFDVTNTPVTEDLILSAVFSKTEGGTGAQYVKVTEELSDWSGEYLLVYDNTTSANGEVFVWTGVDASSCYSLATCNSGVIATKPEGAVTLTIDPMTDGYSIMINGGANDGKYISGTSGSNVLNFDQTDQLNTVSYSNGSVVITSNTSVMRFNSANNNLRFRYFKSTSYSSQQPVQLYKLGQSSTTTYTITAPTEAQQMDITISAAGWATACLPFDAVLTSDDVTAYYAYLDNNGSLVKTPIAADEQIPAETGLLLKSNNGGAATATFVEVTLDEDNISEAWANNMMVGTVAPEGEEFWDGENKYYIMSKKNGVVGFYWDNTYKDDDTFGEGYAAKCGQYKAVLKVSASAPVKSFISFEGNTDADAINAINVNSANNGHIYNLNGQVVDSSYKGIVIKNGKKYINK